MTLMDLPLVIAAGILLLLARHLFLNRKKSLSCPNGHTSSMSEIGRETVRTNVFESGKGTIGGVGFAQSYINFAVTYRCYECGETWTVTEPVR